MAFAAYFFNFVRNILVEMVDFRSAGRLFHSWLSCRSGCLIHNGTYLTLPDTNHNANPTNPNRYSNGNPNPTNTNTRYRCE